VRPYQRQHYKPAFNLRKELYRIFGVDVTNVPGISAVTAHTILSEIGTDLCQFRNASHLLPGWVFAQECASRFRDCSSTSLFSVTKIPATAGRNEPGLPLVNARQPSTTQQNETSQRQSRQPITLWETSQRLDHTSRICGAQSIPTSH
jgi:hypothetical protein